MSMCPCPVSTEPCDQNRQIRAVSCSAPASTPLDTLPQQNADYLKTDPIGTNNWVSIFETYDPNVMDGRTTGTGGTPSDFVATFKVGCSRD